MVYRRRKYSRAFRNFVRKARSPRGRKRRMVRRSKRPAKRARFGAPGRSLRRTALKAVVSGMFPKTKRVYMQYNIDQTFTVGTTDTGMIVPTDAATNLNLRVNSVYDPDPAISGQYNVAAASYKFWAALYNSYVVRRCSIVWDFKQLDTGSPFDPIVVGAKLDTSLAYEGSVNWLKLLSDPTVSSRTMYPTADGKGHVRIVQTYNAKKFFGSDWWTTTKAPFGTNPSKLVYTMLYAQRKSMVASAAARTIHVSAILKYEVYCCDPKDTVAMSGQTMAVDQEA